MLVALQVFIVGIWFDYIECIECSCFGLLNFFSYYWISSNPCGHCLRFFSISCLFVCSHVFILIMVKKQPLFPLLNSKIIYFMIKCLQDFFVYSNGLGLERLLVVGF
jgi:hypothetical protein